MFDVCYASSAVCLQSVTDAGVLSVCENCVDLQRLDVAGCDRLTDATLHALGSNCKHLR